ncbi:dirigent protein 19-like [Dorcoceras hygrometricum]|uniref:Dirigent protein n=1 Tax=Dorcoceras hygrometricum TaxID=472368 RepID=A0A2Z7D1K9_9LAMI|nr:dirigent protein 19-like [Dorcoceras hygrometricum]
MGPESTQKWLKTRQWAKERVTRLQFYVRDVFSSPTTKNVTTTNVIVAKANSTFGSPTLFGLVAVIDDPVTVGPEPGSKIIGRAEGIVTFASLERISLHMTFTIVFTGGEYIGSTLSFLGHNACLSDEVGQISIAGGTGAFMVARGVAFVNTISSNSSSDTLFEYNAFILHY